VTAQNTLATALQWTGDILITAYPRDGKPHSHCFRKWKKKAISLNLFRFVEKILIDKAAQLIKELDISINFSVYKRQVHIHAASICVLDKGSI